MEKLPDKIYVQIPSRNWIGRTWNETPIKEGDNPNWKNATNIEYIRKDAFIEKLETWLNKRHKRDRYTLIYFRKHFKDIINEMMDD